MYTPKKFQEPDRNALLAMIAERGFGALVSSQADGRMQVSHVPLDLMDAGTDPVLVGHLAKANAQWRDLQKAAQVVAIFSGPDAYVSPQWYDHVNVPTWNYVAVHAHCEARLIEDREALLRLVTRQVERYERAPESSYTVASLPAEVLDRELRGIVGFELRIVRLEGSFKLSQDRNPADHGNIVRQLESSACPADHGVAALMRDRDSERTPGT